MLPGDRGVTPELLMFSDRDLQPDTPVTGTAGAGATAALNVNTTESGPASVRSHQGAGKSPYLDATAHLHSSPGGQKKPTSKKYVLPPPPSARSTQKQSTNKASKVSDVQDIKALTMYQMVDEVIT